MVSAHHQDSKLVPCWKESRREKSSTEKIDCFTKVWFFWVVDERSCDLKRDPIRYLFVFCFFFFQFFYMYKKKIKCKHTNRTETLNTGAFLFISFCLVRVKDWPTYSGWQVHVILFNYTNRFIQWRQREILFV